VPFLNLPNDSPDSFPPDSPRKISEIIEENLKKRGDIGIGPFRSGWIGCPGKVDKKCLPFDMFSFQKTPPPGILAVVPIVPQHTVLTLGDLEWTKVVSIGVFCRKYLIIHMLGRKPTLCQFSINIQPFVHYFNYLTFGGNYPLDELFAGIKRIVKNNNIPYFRLVKMISQFTDQQKITLAKGVFHGSGGNSISLNHIGA
jgi:hypothetical protein